MPVRIFIDGDQFCALIGNDIQEGCAGFGNTIPEALRSLADEWESDTTPETVIAVDGGLDDQ